MPVDRGALLRIRWLRGGGWSRREEEDGRRGSGSRAGEEQGQIPQRIPHAWPRMDMKFRSSVLG